MKYEMNYILFSKIYVFLQQGNAWNKTRGTYELPNIHDKKWINKKEASF